MKRLGLLVLFLVAGLVCGQGQAWAKRTSKDTVIEDSRGTNGRTRWQELSPEQRNKLKQRYRQFQKLPAEKKQRMRKDHRRLQELSPQQRNELERELRRIRQLPPEERRRQGQQLRREYFNGNRGGEP